ncbi:sugar kinase [Streptomyces endophytica]|uniref:Sugar kinase n=1 Tax=Streptomyces endophytica TaxID=2991496 RepID=A0ABY6P7P1_9ACTN|nr:sugar kinase [Streptomyces endophytica]UZJ29806.1 sugar kinase [Streptomyces endophytica]
MTTTPDVSGTHGPGGTPAPAAEVVCLGESMVTFLPGRPGRLADVPSFDRAIGGAESNVACMLAAAGHRTKWVSRVGADGFGDHLVDTIAGYGVDTSAVRRDRDRPTGIYFRTAGDRATDAHEVAYYRAGSAASAMSVTTLDTGALQDGRILHLSGITAALSADCLDLLRTLTARRPGRRPLVSFDVNHRPGLWRGSPTLPAPPPLSASFERGRPQEQGGTPVGPRVLLDLARGADLVFVGEDEARDAWGLHGDRAIREALPEPELLVVKRGASGAVVFHGGDRAEGHGGERLAVRAPDVDVVAAVGAGDAFAAGFLSATLRGLPLRTRVRHGHLFAAAALTVPGDLAAPPGRALADRLAALDADAWEKLHLGPGWIAATQEAVEEVHTP